MREIPATRSVDGADGVMARAAECVAVSQVRLTTANIDFLTRLSAYTRMAPGRYLTRIDVLRLLLDEFLSDPPDPRRVTSLAVLRRAIDAQSREAVRSPGSPLEQLAVCFRACDSSGALRS